jgi:hypothetical protein
LVLFIGTLPVACHGVSISQKEPESQLMMKYHNLRVPC